MRPHAPATEGLWLKLRLSDPGEAAASYLEVGRPQMLATGPGHVCTGSSPQNVLSYFAIKNHYSATYWSIMDMCWVEVVPPGSKVKELI